jgi:biopolymer transport protein TolQ
MFGLLLAEEIAEVTLQPTTHKLSELFWQADLFIKITLLLILFFSIASWAIIGMKHRQLKRVRKKSEKFLGTFWRSPSIDALVKRGHFIRSPITQIFKSGVSALKDHAEQKNKERIAYSIRKTAEDEVANLESYTPFLATTASVAPFLGLFGTVWGILNAFWALKYSSGSTSLEVFGPHIGEALSTTALGLVAAIPAVIFYNLFASKVHVLTRDLNHFADDFLNRIDDEYLK